MSKTTVATRLCLCGCGGEVNPKMGGQKWVLGHDPRSTKPKTMPLAYDPMPERPERCEKCGSAAIFLDTPIHTEAALAEAAAYWQCFNCSWTRFLNPGTTLEGKYILTRAPRPRQR